ncbi:hypothetical protein DdX_17268 [Ditylenchus destructor]|uniref:F-box domain-containing protein n=1 Tax=Ditylenchus destructor TaxID=166010 RepID=A0AAD4QZ52_9BILA|nr:hypothetical protein DdX_17268 [Ditylenchus destructor]
MSSLPNEIFYNVTKFLPNDDITDLMLLSKKFNVLVTPRLRKIDQEMATMDQSIDSFMPSPAPEHADREWISQLNLKRFEPIGSKAKKRMKQVFENEKDFQNFLVNVSSHFRSTSHFRIISGSTALGIAKLDSYKEIMSLERLDDLSFLQILGVLVAMPKFRQEYNISAKFARCIHMEMVTIYSILNNTSLHTQSIFGKFLKEYCNFIKLLNQQ